MTDTDYINEHYPNATDSQKEAMAERIAVMVIDGMIDEQKTRERAIFGKFEDAGRSVMTRLKRGNMVL